MFKVTTGLTFTIGDLLGYRKTPPCFLKIPCESCHKEEATCKVRDSFSFSFDGSNEVLHLCKDCGQKVQDEEDDERYD